MKEQIIGILLSIFIRKKNKNLIILSFDRNKFLFNTRVFFEYILQRKDHNLDVKYIINNKNKKKILEKKYGKHFISTRNIGDIILILRAKAWLVDGGFPIKTPFGHKDRLLINFWHGTPIKYIGLDGHKGLDKIRVWLQLKMVSKYYNAFFIISERVREIIEKTFLINKNKIKLLGQPRNDLIFLKNDRKKIIEKLFTNIPIYKKVILYAPTYRDVNLMGKRTQFFPFIDFEKKDFEEFLSNNNILFCIRNHHLDTLDFKETKHVKFLNNTKIENISEILNIFDLLITDYSGIIYDYLFLERPMLFLPYDLEDYKNKVGLYFEYDITAPGPKPTTYLEFKKDIKKLLNENDYYLKERKNMSNYFKQIGQGNCERAYEYLLRELEK